MIKEPENIPVARMSLLMAALTEPRLITMSYSLVIAVLLLKINFAVFSGYIGIAGFFVIFTGLLLFWKKMLLLQTLPDDLAHQMQQYNIPVVSRKNSSGKYGCTPFLARLLIKHKQKYPFYDIDASPPRNQFYWIHLLIAFILAIAIMKY